MPTLEWIGKDKVINHHQEVPFRVLERKYSFDESGQHEEDNGSENMIIRGDNLEALKALLPRYEGRVKCIYIDPPYNTGNEGWVYNDNVNDPKIKKWLGEVVGKEGEDLTRHDKWLCMMYPRLKLLQKLLHPTDGSIFISIDENEIQNLKLICNEIFGSSHHVATIAWQKRYSRENRGAIGDAHEYILVYASDVEIFKVIRHKVEFDENSAKVYKNPNNDPKGRWRAVPMTAQGYRPNQMYPITTPSGKVCYPPQGRCWSTVESEYKKLLEAGRIYFGKHGDSQPSTIRYLSEVEGMIPWTWWPHEEVGHTDEAKKEIITILGKGEGKKAVEGTGGSFGFYELGEPLLIGDCLNEAVGTEKIREYIWFTETKRPYAPPRGGNPYYLGQNNHTGYYFYYEPDRMTVLDYAFLSTITEKTDGAVIYADRCAISQDKLVEMEIMFKKIPRDISRL